MVRAQIPPLTYDPYTGTYSQPGYDTTFVAVAVIVVAAACMLFILFV